MHSGSGSQPIITRCSILGRMLRSDITNHDPLLALCKELVNEIKQLHHSFVLSNIFMFLQKELKPKPVPAYGG